MPIYLSLHKMVLAILIFSFHYYLLGLGSASDRIYSFALTLNAFMGFFFVISGFLVAQSLQHKSLNYAQFVKRRLLRLYPLYAAAFLLCFTLLLLFSQSANTLTTSKLTGYLLIGLSGTIGIFPSLINFGISGYLWSMTPEIIAAFIAFPLYALIAAAPQKNVQTAALTLFAVIFCYPLVVMLLGVGDVEISFVHYPSVLLRTGEFVLGLMLGCLEGSHRSGRSGRGLLWLATYIGLWALFLYLATSYESHSFFYESLTVAMASASVLYAKSLKRQPSIHPMHLWIADFCYAFYLVHIPLLYVLFVMRQSDVVKGAEISVYFSVLILAALCAFAVIVVKNIILWAVRKHIYSE